MGIREAIEGLPTEPVARPQRQVGYAKVHDDYINRADALSILDEWELVAEHGIGSLGPDILHRIAVTDNGDLVTDFVLKSGESIAIYRRRQ